MSGATSSSPRYAKPELVATAPTQVWSWDITKLKGPAKLVYFYLYVIVDIFSRYVVGWMIAEAENAGLAERLTEQSCSKQGIASEQLTLHADRGSPMISKTVAQLLTELGIDKSHGQPRVSNDTATLVYPLRPSTFAALRSRGRDVARARLFHGGRQLTLELQGLPFGGA